MDFYDVLRSRQSVRAYEPREVPEADLRKIFEAAQRAPSWCNIQPWRVTLLSGEARERLRKALVSATSAAMPNPEVAFPPDYPEPYQSHRRECAKVLYRAMGIPTNMFTVMFSIGRLPGWLAHWKELRDSGARINRPRQIYTGANERDYVELAQRG